MNLVPKMYLKIIDTHLWTGRVELAWAVFTLYSRVIHEFHVLWLRLIRADGYWQVCDSGNSCVTHCSFERIIAVGLLLLKASKS